MAPQLDAAQRILIKTLLAQGFESQLIASNALCTVRTVQRIRLERRSETPTRRTGCVGRRGCMTSTMRKALCDALVKQPYLYRCKIAARPLKIQVLHHGCLPSRKTLRQDRCHIASSLAVSTWPPRVSPGFCRLLRGPQLANFRACPNRIGPGR
jgi:hypothetical protein